MPQRRTEYDAGSNREGSYRGRRTPDSQRWNPDAHDDQDEMNYERDQGRFGGSRADQRGFDQADAEYSQRSRQSRAPQYQDDQDWGFRGRQDRGYDADSRFQSGQNQDERRFGTSHWSPQSDRSQQYRGVGLKGFQRSDERLHEQVCERLTDEGSLDASNIDVKVSSGEVTLDGEVDSRWAKRHAEDCVESVSGIKHCQNNLRVSRNTERQKNNPAEANGQSARSGKQQK